MERWKTTGIIWMDEKLLENIAYSTFNDKLSNNKSDDDHDNDEHNDADIDDDDDDDDDDDAEMETTLMMMRTSYALVKQLWCAFTLQTPRREES